MKKVATTKKSKEDPKARNLRLKRIIEALLFSASEPISAERIVEIIVRDEPISLNEVKSAIAELSAEYDREERSFEIAAIASGFLLRTKETFSHFVERLRGKREERLSRAASEILAIIAYLQPVTRAQIEKIRGVDSSGSLLALQERELIEVVGRLELPGRPAQYGITRRFLTHFGLNSVNELMIKLGFENSAHGSGT
jgi:segregation and condensation protein B